MRNGVKRLSRLRGKGFEVKKLRVQEAFICNIFSFSQTMFSGVQEVYRRAVV